MVSNSQKTEQEKSVLRWGGWAGILSGLVFILSVVVVAAGPVGMEEPVDLAGWVTRFPDIRAARIVENSLYLGGLILGILLILTLYRALRETRLAPALFGCALGILGLALLAAGALPHVATAPLSDLYHAPGATPADQAALALMWQATWAIFDALLAAGFILLQMGLVALGVAMLGAPAFGKGLGWVSVALGAVGFIAAVLNMIESSAVGVLSFFAMIVFSLATGWKLLSLSRSSVARVEGRGAMTAQS